jgi:citrate synthase
MAGKGLEGIIAARTALSHVYGEEGRLIYRGYEIGELAEQSSFEETCHLLWFGELPTDTQLESLRTQLRREATVDQRVLDTLKHAHRSAHPMSMLRTGVSALGLLDPEAEDMSPEANQRKAIRLTAQTVTLTAAITRLRRGEAPIPPRHDLDLAANLLYMMRGKLADELEVRIIDVALTLHAEHGMNASTFAARVAAGTLTDMHSAVIAAIGTLKGPIHGGANEQVMTMLEQIGDASAADAWVRAALGRGEKIMGFGHRVYNTTDPRAPILKRLAEQMSSSNGRQSKWLAISEQVQATVREEMDRRGKKIYPNVDFFSASVYFTLGIPKDEFTNIFASARMAGWTAHIIEQYTDNRLIRPESEYIGPGERPVPTKAQRR